MKKWWLAVIPVAVVAVALGGFLAVKVFGGGSGPLRVDFGRPNTRPGPDPSYEEWTLGNESESDTRKLKGLTVTVRGANPPGARLRADWWKDGVMSHPEANVVSDGIMIEEGVPGSEIELRIGGLDPGPHTLLTYHNTWQNPEKHTFSRVNVSIDGTQRVSGLVPTNRVMKDTDSEMSYLEFAAKKGEDVVILYQADPGDTSVTQTNVTLAAFEIDTPDPRVGQAESSSDVDPAAGD
ncbi:hypothetical protein JW916_00920 [Candidatus Sumerlaeota bacterium]|nr:hypothetical protein [Candidatus Sumerlaeota bacterium]